MKKFFASIAVLAAMAMAVPAMASEAPGYGVTLGGRVKVDAGWQILPEGSNRNNSDGTIANFFLSVNSLSYFRGLFTSADKTIGMHLELGLGSIVNRDNNGENTGDNTVSTRQAFGWWKVGSCRLLVGQYMSRLGGIYLPNSNLGHTKSLKGNLAGFGFIGATRNPKIGLQVGINDYFSFDVALGQAGAESNSSSTNWGATGSTNSYLPRLEVVLNFNFGNFSINPGFGIGYQQWKYDEDSNPLLSDYDDHVLSYLLWLPMQFKTGPFTIMFNAFYGQNMDLNWTGEWGTTNNWGSGPGSGGRMIYQFGGQPSALPMLNANHEVEDSKTFAAGLAMDYAFTDQLSVSVGGGMNYSQNDAWATAANDRDDYTRWGAYVAVPYKLTQNLTIAPEIAYYNYGKWVGVTSAGKDDDKAKDEWLLGVHFQFLF